MNNFVEHPLPAKIKISRPKQISIFKFSTKNTKGLSPIFASNNKRLFLLPLKSKESLYFLVISGGIEVD